MPSFTRPIAAAVAAVLSVLVVAPATLATAPQIPQEFGAAGSPIHRRCEVIDAAVTQMRSGMSTQQDWIRRAEAQLRAAEGGVVDSQDAVRDYAMNAVKDFALGQINEMATLRRKVEALSGAGLKDPKARRRVLELAKKAEKVNELADELLKKQAQADRDFDFSKKVRENKAALEDLIKYADESGLAEQGISALALVGGPAGKLAAEAGKVIIDVSLLAYGSSISGRELNRARADLEHLRETHRRNDGIIHDLELERAAASCPQPNTQTQQSQQPTPAPRDQHLTPPLPEPATPAVTPPPDKGPSFVKTMLGSIAIAGGALAGVMAYEEYKAAQELVDGGSSGSGSGSSSGGSGMTYVGNSTNGFQCTFNSGGIINNCTATITVNIKSSVAVGTRLRLQTSNFGIGGNQTTTANPPGNMTFSLSGGTSTSSCPGPVTRLDLMNTTTLILVAQTTVSIPMTCR